MNKWQRKLLAFLHDPPHKALDIQGHEEARKPFITQAGFDSASAIQWFEKSSDFLAAAADRFPAFTSDLRSPFGGASHPFKHPLGGSELVVPGFPTPEMLGGVLQTVQPREAEIPADITGENRDRINFFLHWRRWPVAAAHKEWRSAFMPAETRLPDHSIWLHNGIVSALQGCAEENGRVLRPSFLMLQLGPVQEFIEQARSTRDLWSGSYLLSWLMAHAIKAVTDHTGSDAVVFPFLRAQPIFDLLHRDEIYARVKYGGDTMWSRMKQHERDMLVPSLPNRFLAVVPAADAEVLARAAGAAVADELKKIAAATWDWLNVRQPLDDGWRKRFDAQIAAFAQVHWQTVPWTDFQSLERPASETSNDWKPVDAVLSEFAKFGGQAAKDLARIRKLPARYDHNAGFVWPYHYALTDRLLAARRNTRDFAAWKTDELQAGSLKDSFSGKEEIVGDEDWWKAARAQKELRFVFRSGDTLGAINLVKKTWHKAYLEKVWKLDVRKALDFDSVPDIAAAMWLRELPGRLSESLKKHSDAPYKLETALRTIQDKAAEWDFRAPAERVTIQNLDEALNHFSPEVFLTSSWKEKSREKNGMDREETEVIRALNSFFNESKIPAPPSYAAVIALDGDDMGRWLSGEKTPPLAWQFSAEARAKFGREVADIRRPLSPSYHLQFSEALSNFSSYVARPVVEHFGGQLIYAGGDDVLAMVPAAQALECAEALRAGFRGDFRLAELVPGIFEVCGTSGGFVKLLKPKGEQPTWPMIMPGPRADVSCGIAVGHIHAPLQGLVRAARKAEKEAKKRRGDKNDDPRCGAFALALHKRSGEIVEWGARWDSGATGLFRCFIANDAHISGKFAYALHALLAPYTPAASAVKDVPGFDAATVLELEWNRVAERQIAREANDVREALSALAPTYWSHLSRHSPGRLLTDFSLLFRAAAFVLRGERT